MKVEHPFLKYVEQNFFFCCLGFVHLHGRLAAFIEQAVPIPGTELMHRSPNSPKHNTMDLKYES